MHSSSHVNGQKGLLLFLTQAEAYFKHCFVYYGFDLLVRGGSLQGFRQSLISTPSSVQSFLQVSFDLDIDVISLIVSIFCSVGNV